jgi:hypothetical protein
MQTVAEPTRTYKPIAKRATVYSDVTLTQATTGVALRMADGHVFFRADGTGLWSELVDADLPRVILHGQEDLILTAMIADGDLVVRTSRTLQGKASA